MAESLRELGWVMCSAGAGKDASVRVLDWGPWRLWQPVRGRTLCVRSINLLNLLVVGADESGGGCVGTVFTVG